MRSRPWRRPRRVEYIRSLLVCLLGGISLAADVSSDMPYAEQTVEKTKVCTPCFDVLSIMLAQGAVMLGRQGCGRLPDKLCTCEMLAGCLHAQLHSGCALFSPPMAARTSAPAHCRPPNLPRTPPCLPPRSCSSGCWRGCGRGRRTATSSTPARFWPSWCSSRVS